MELVKIGSAEAVAATLSGDLATRDVVGDTRRIADEIGYRGGHNLADVAEILVCLRDGHPAGALAARAKVDRRTAASGGNTYSVPIAIAWTDGVAASHFPAVDWIATDTLLRWADVRTGGVRQSVALPHPGRRRTHAADGRSLSAAIPQPSIGHP